MKHLLLIFLFLNFSLVNSTIKERQYYSQNLRGELVVVNKKAKTVAVLIKALSCSGCIKSVAYFLNKQNIDSTESLIIISENRNNTLINKERKNFLKNLFHNTSDIFFEYLKDSLDTTNTISLKGFKESDFPVILLFNNIQKSIDTVCFDDYIISQKIIIKFIND